MAHYLVYSSWGSQHFAHVPGCSQWGQAGQQEVKTGERHKVCGDLVQIHIQGSLKAH